jgi:hypothetical protein
MPWCRRECASRAEAYRDPGLGARHPGQPDRGAVRENDRFLVPALDEAFTLPTRLPAVQHTGSEKQRSINQLWYEYAEPFSRSVGSVGCSRVVLRTRGLILR